MSQEYSRAALRVCVAQICQYLGWNSIQATPLELLTDVLERYLLEVGKTTHRYSEQFGRCDPRIEDAFIAFEHMGIAVNELADFVKHVEPLPFAKEIVSFPVPSQNDLKFPNPDSKEVQQRKVFEFVPEHLPYMHPELNEEEEEEDTNQSVAPASPERLQVEPQGAELSPSPSQTGEKRPVPSPTDSPQTFKRPRLTTSQPLPEEATQSQYEMTSVVMTQSGILSSLVEGKAPDIKKPPVGIKQNVIIVRQRSSSNASQPPTPGSVLSGDQSIIRLDFNKDPSKGGKIIPVAPDVDSGAIMDRSDPEYRPKSKKKNFKDVKRDKPFKIKRGPGRPRSPGRAAAVVHNKRTPDFRIPKIGERPIGPSNQDVALDLTTKPTPPAPNINVVKFIEESGDSNGAVDYRPKVFPLSRQQERDMEDTIDSVIGKRNDQERKVPEYEVKEHTLKDYPEKKKKKSSEQWTVSQISESYSEDNDSDSKEHLAENSGAPSYPPPVIAPHLLLLQSPQQPRPRGRPRGSTSGFYRSISGRSPMGGRKPGRPPLRGRSPVRSPGRPPLLNRSPGRPPLSRSPGMSRSPGRPPLNRSPGRPPLNRSPGRPKSTPGLSPRPRGRPRGSGSKSPRNASPRGGSPRAPISNLSFDETNQTSNTNIFKLETDDSGATLFDFPTKSPVRDISPKKEIMSPSSRGSPPRVSRSSSMSSAAPTEPALSRENTPELSDSPVKHEPSPSPEPSAKSRETEISIKHESSVSPVRDRDISPKKVEISVSREYSDGERYHKEKERSQSEESDRKEKKYDKDHSSEREHSKERIRDREQDREFKAHKRDREREKEYDREFKEHSRDREQDRERDRGYSKEQSGDKEHIREREKDIEYKELIRDRERDREFKEHSRDRERDREYSKDHTRDRDRDREYSKEHSRDREHKEHSKDRERDHKEHSQERGHKEHSKEHSQERGHKEHSKEHSREREHKEHSRDRDRDRSKEHRKDKKKKKKKNREREKEREDKEKDRKDKHKLKEKVEKIVREESPSLQPLQVQKLKIKFGGGSASTPASFSISSAQSKAASPKPEASSPKPEMTVPKLKFKMMPPKPDMPGDGDTQSWVSSIKEERHRSPTPKREPMFPSPKVSPKPSPKPKPSLDSESDADSGKDDDDDGGNDEVTVSVVKGKIITKKPAKRGKRKGSAKKGKSKSDSSIFRKGIDGEKLFPDKTESLISAIKREMKKEGSPISPAFSPQQNVPSPITIPALKAAPPPPSPPAALKKSIPKTKPGIKEPRPHSPLFKDIIKAKPVSLPIPKPPKPGRKPSPKKSPKVSPLVKKKGNLSPTKTSPTKAFPFMDFQPPRTPSPRRSLSPSASVPSSPMYSPASSPGRDSPLQFQIPPTPAFPTRHHSPPNSPPSVQLSEEVDPPSRHLSTDDEPDTPTSDKPKLNPADLPPMPPTAAQRRAQRSIITETVGSFVNECGEKIWICPACTMQDDGSPMIGCDKCDDWYHWPCVGIKAEPEEEESWFCPKCIKPSKNKGSKRGRKKKKP